ncbi:hypothetical protein P153DRAFT_115165 [Dothidotthia symphoricarpi CBS 119687]|uniref:Uncharacterized protein n=1 Tax=Dothidotthia symphoricarpi CBS 119687 TaxID=1392245 RepID=A0A6A6A2Z1_9PLEO|nr:uncharacterized protein P153DRAFT_115165 [Dothidotthia symphoricarpi CBS 119687]KAF2125533.1 hypothetical protein P153DRAFT_115165 [Dothidotthia symphoricarpi CBS 119687]
MYCTARNKQRATRLRGRPPQTRSTWTNTWLQPSARLWPVSQATKRPGGEASIANAVPLESGSGEALGVGNRRSVSSEETCHLVGGSSARHDASQHTTVEFNKFQQRRRARRRKRRAVSIKPDTAGWVGLRAGARRRRDTRESIQPDACVHVGVGEATIRRALTWKSESEVKFGRAYRSPELVITTGMVSNTAVRN